MDTCKNKEYKDRLLKALFFLLDIIEKENVHYWVDGGTLLGAVRDGKLIDHDEDADVSIFEKDWEKIAKHEKEFNDRGLSILRKTDGVGVIFYTKDAVEMYGSAGDKVKNVADRVLHIDVFNWKKKGNNLTREYANINRNNGKDFPIEWVKETTNITLEGREVKAPGDTERFVRFRYGDLWRIPMERKTFNKIFEEKIPLKIHQIWIGEKAPPQEWMNTWKIYDYKLWTEKEIDKLGLENRDVYERYYNAKKYHGATDVARAEILKRFGGVYVDCDMERVKDIKPLITGSFMACYEGVGDLIGNSVIGAIPNHPIIKESVRKIGVVENIEPAWKKVGPELFTSVIPSELELLPAATFFPEHYSGKKSEGVSYTKHYWGTTKKIYKNDIVKFNPISEKDININIMAHPKRKEYIPYLKEKLGHVPVIWDRKNSVWDTRRRCLKEHIKKNKRWSITVQDDALVCDNFKEKVVEFMNNIGVENALYNFFFSVRFSIDELYVGIKDGFVKKGDLYNEVAFAAPTKTIPSLINYCDGISNIKCDYPIRKYFKSIDYPTYFSIPSLIDHRIGASIFRKNVGSEDYTERVALWFADNKNPLENNPRLGWREIEGKWKRIIV